MGEQVCLTARLHMVHGTRDSLFAICFVIYFRLTDAFSEAVEKLQTLAGHPLTREQRDAFMKPDFRLQRLAIREGAFNPQQTRLLLASLSTRITTGTVRRLSLSPHGIFLDGPLANRDRQGANLYYAVRAQDSAVGVLKVYYPCDAPTATAEAEWKVSELLSTVAVSHDLSDHRACVVRYSSLFDLGSRRVGLFMPAYVRSLNDFMSTPHMSERHVSLPDQFLLRTAISVLRALVLMHSAGIAHCDVKADNIMFNGDGTATLIDLGAATEFGGIVREGIPDVMALGLNIGEGNPKVDLVSLAVTLWWATYGFSESPLPTECSPLVLLRLANEKVALNDHSSVASAIAAILSAETASGALETTVAIPH